jgi:hypothetical protein
MQTAAGVWPDYLLETNLFCCTRQLAVVEGKQACQFRFTAATAINKEAVKFYFLVRKLSRLFCCVGSGPNVDLP